MEELNPYLCTRCFGGLTMTPVRGTCGSCGASFVRDRRVIDLRNPYETPTPTPAVPKDCKHAELNASKWSNQIRAHINACANRTRALYESTVVGRTAWNLLLRIPRDANVLDIGCGTGVVTSSLAPLSGQTIGVDVVPNLLQLAQTRCELLALSDRIWLSLIGSASTLPFRDGFFDCIVLSERVSCSSNGWLRIATTPDALPGELLNWERLAHVTDLRRILKPGGQLFWLADNRLSYRRLANCFRGTYARADGLHSYIGYHRLLRNAGFSNVDFFGSVGSTGAGHQIRLLRGVLRNWKPKAPRALTAKLKALKLTVPSYGVDALNGTSDQPRLLDELLRRIEQEVSPGVESPFAIERFRVSSKDKLIITGRVGPTEAIVRVPLSEQARVSEAQNARMIRELLNNASISQFIPRPLVHGRFRSIYYYAETRVPGIPIKNFTGRSDLKKPFEQALLLLDKMNPGVDAASGVPLTGQRFEREVTKRIDRLESVLDDSGRRAKLRDYFTDELYGVRLPFGVVHGDFSSNNILVDADCNVSGLIDWEDSSDHGVLAIDAINFVESVHRSTTGQAVGVVIPGLAAGHFHSKAAERFLQSVYEKYGVAESCHEALVYFKWLRHIAFVQAFRLRYDTAGIERLVLPVGDAIANSK